MTKFEEFKKNFKIYSPFAPTLFTSMSGQKYAIAIGSPWLEVPDEMTLEDVHNSWIKPQKKVIEPKVKKMVISRKKEFIVTLTDKWRCTCSSFKTKRKCLHIDQVKSEV